MKRYLLDLTEGECRVLRHLARNGYGDGQFEEDRSPAEVRAMRSVLKKIDHPTVVDGKKKQE